MASARSAWGIDIGNRALKAVKLVREGDRFRVEDFEIIEHEQILSIAGDNKESLIQTALAHFVERHQVRNSVVGVSVSGQQSFARFIKLPPVEPKKIPEIVKFEAIQQIPFPLDEVEWAYQLFQQDESPDVEVGIFAMKKELVNRHINYFTNLGLNVQVVQMHPLAVYNAMRYDDRVQQTTMFMDTGAENTDLVIAEGESVWLRSLPIGGNNFTEALAKAFKLNFQKAEELKRNAATSKYAKQIFQAMRPVFADLVSEIQRSMGFYASVHRESRISRIVALGSTFQLPGLQKYLQQNLQLPVEKIDSFRALPPADAKLAAAFQEGMISLAGAYGLALQTMGEAKITSSLLPETIRRQKMWKEKQPWFAAAAACFVVGTLGAYGAWYWNDMVYDTKSGVRSEIQAVYRETESLSSSWKNNVEDKGKDDIAKLLNVRSLQSYRDLGDILLDVLATAPNGTLEQLKKVPRPQRKQIVVERVIVNYAPNVQPALVMSAEKFGTLVGKDQQQMIDSPGNYAPQPSNDGVLVAPPRYNRLGRGGFVPPEEGTSGGFTDEGDTNLGGTGNGPRGYLVTIRGHTPNAGKETFIEDNFVKQLMVMNSDTMFEAKKSYFVARAQLISSSPRKGGVPANDGPDEVVDDLGQGTTPQGKEPLDPKKDRIFPDEMVTGDTEFTVLAVIVLDPAPPAPKEGAPAAK